MEHRRSFSYKGTNVDPYIGISQDIELRKGSSLLRFGIVRNGYRDYLNLQVRNVLIPYSLYLGLATIFAKYFALRQRLLISLVIENVDEIFELQYNKEQYRKKLSLVLAGNFIAKWFFAKLIKIDKVLVVDAYNSNSCFVKSFNEAGIETIEYQHGVIAPGHVAYNCYVKDSEALTAVVPSKLFVWSELWRKFQALDKQSKLEVVPWTYEAFCCKYEDISGIAETKDLVFIMQPSMQETGIECIKAIIDSNKDLSISVKMHPKQRGLELPFACDVYYEEDIHKVIMEHRVVVGFFSTALFEAVSLGKGVYSIKDSSFSEYFCVLEEAGIRIVSDFTCIDFDPFGDDKKESHTPAINLTSNFDIDVRFD